MSRWSEETELKNGLHARSEGPLSRGLGENSKRRQSLLGKDIYTRRAEVELRDAGENSDNLPLRSLRFRKSAVSSRVLF